MLENNCFTSNLCTYVTGVPGGYHLNIDDHSSFSARAASFAMNLVPKKFTSDWMSIIPEADLDIGVRSAAAMAKHTKGEFEKQPKYKPSARSDEDLGEDPGESEKQNQYY